MLKYVVFYLVKSNIYNTVKNVLWKISINNDDRTVGKVLKSNIKLLISGVEMRKELVVEVVDFIMGSGKSHACFEWINNNNHEKFIYVSPILSEVGSEGRIHQEITGVEFSEILYSVR